MSKLKFILVSINLFSLIFLSCGFIIAHHENYDHTFIVSHYIQNNTENNISLRFNTLSKVTILAPTATYGNTYKYLNSSTMPQADFASWKSLSDSVQIVFSQNKNQLIHVNFIFDTLTYPSNELISAVGSETFLYADTFFVTESKLIDGKRWVVMGGKVFE